MSFNLGRPPGILDDHIDAQFPEETPEITLGLHHIRHRQIQSKLLTNIYCGQQKLAEIDPKQKNEIIAQMQQGLDHWKSTLHDIYPSTNSPYPLP